MHRKGATRAFSGDSGHVHDKFTATGQPVLVPGDMGTGSWIMAGPKSGQNQAFGSSCHGAGEHFLEQKAKKTIDGKSIERNFRRILELEFMLQLQMYYLKKHQMLTRMLMR